MTHFRTIRGLRNALAIIASSALFLVSKPSRAELSATAENARTEIAIPFFILVSYFCYAIGIVFVISGILMAKKHSDAPMSQPLGPAIARLFAGGAFLAAPSLIGMLQQTGFATFGSQFFGAQTIPF